MHLNMILIMTFFAHLVAHILGNVNAQGLAGIVGTLPDVACSTRRVRASTISNVNHV